MKTNQSFIGAYARNRRGAQANETPANVAQATATQATATHIAQATEQGVPAPHVPSTPGPVNRATAPPQTSRKQSSEFDAQSLDAQSNTELTQRWINQSAGQVLRVDTPVTQQPSEPEPATATVSPASAPIQPSELESTIPAALASTPPAPAKLPTQEVAASPQPRQPLPLPPQPIETPAPTPVQEPDVAPAPVSDPVAAPRTIRTPQPVVAEPPANQWKGSDWEVDSFEIPHSVAELFFEETFFRSIAEHMGRSVRDGLRSVLVTSLSSGEGRSTVAIGTAIAAAATGLRVALVDTDLNAPSQADLLRLEIESDWASAIRHGQPLESGAITSIEDNVTLLPLMSTPAPSTPVTPMEIDRLLQRVDGCFDLVMFDAPVVRSWATARIALSVDSCLIVRDARATGKKDVALAAEQLRQHGVRGIGVVDNFCN